MVHPTGILVEVRPPQVSRIRRAEWDRGSWAQVAGYQQAPEEQGFRSTGVATG
jgi:hypothetical protein